MNFVSGTTVQIRWQYRPVTTKMLADPTTVYLVLKPPVGVTAEYTYPTNITKNATGDYQINRQLGVIGKWYGRAEGAGAASGVIEFEFNVVASNVL